MRIPTKHLGGLNHAQGNKTNRIYKKGVHLCTYGAPEK